MNVLVTGGAGYIGSHVVKILTNYGYKPIILDDLSTGHAKAVHGHELIEGDLKNKNFVLNVFKNYKLGAVIHLAASSIVGESVKKPEKYYRNNLIGTINLLKAMKLFNVNKIVFSSTAAVYGQPKNIPISEDEKTNPNNPYGRSKLYIENIMNDYKNAYGLKYISLRYFNAAGADLSGEVGEDHNPETHLIPIILQVALGKRKKISIFGTDYPTKDGTCIRDYIHVLDLAEAHILALKALNKSSNHSNIYNLGNGKGFSVKEVIDEVRKITGKSIEVSEGEKRKGDPPKLIAKSSRAKNELGWDPQYNDLRTIIKTAWDWHLMNPRGFNS